MNKNINLVEILKDCPKGTKFYSTVYGNITLDFVDKKNSAFTFCIHMIEDDGTPISFTKEGKIYNIEDGECVIFPSKDQRDWNVWYEYFVKEKSKKVFQSFNDGDYIHFNTGNTWTVIYRKTDELEVRGYACQSDDYISIMEDKGYVGTKPYARNARLATPKEIAQLDDALIRLKKRWNPTTKEVEGIKIEMTISEIEKKLGLTSGSLRIKK
jgi:hypothetical protein